MLQKLFLFFACFGLSAAASLGAATFDLSASVDRKDLELGESLRYTLSLQVNGRMDFPVQIDTPRFDGFQAQGPSRQDGSTWINGAVTEQHVFSWDLVPIKAGTLVLPPIKANAKDAATGEVIKSTPAFSINVRRPKNAYNGLAPQATPMPTYGVQTQPTPGMDDTGLRDIKGDRGLPWVQVGLVLGAFAAVLGLLALWARRPGKEELPQRTVKDPKAHALHRLERARREYEPGKEAVMALAVHNILQEYLQQTYELWQGSTFGEGLRVARRRDGSLVPSLSRLKGRLEALVFGKANARPDDAGLMYDGARLFITDIENVKKGGPHLRLLAQDLEKAAKLPDPIGLMRDRFTKYLQQVHGLSQIPQMKALLEQVLIDMDVPRLVNTAEQVLGTHFSKSDDPEDFKDALISLARVLGPGKIKESDDGK